MCMILIRSRLFFLLGHVYCFQNSNQSKCSIISFFCFFFLRQIAAFNPGGVGQRSERIPIRIGAKQQPNPELVMREETEDGEETDEGGVRWRGEGGGRGRGRATSSAVGVASSRRGQRAVGSGLIGGGWCLLVLIATITSLLLINECSVGRINHRPRLWWSLISDSLSSLAFHLLPFSILLQITHYLFPVCSLLLA